jgi:hypothetical protein
MSLSGIPLRLHDRATRYSRGFARPARLSVCVLIVLMSLVPLRALAQQYEGADAPASQAGDSAKLGGWSFEFIPYFWLPEIYGNIQVRRISASFQVDYSQLFELLGHGNLFGGAGHFEAKNGRLSLFVDAFGVHVTPSGESQRAKVDSTINVTFVEFGPSYRLLELPSSWAGERPIVIEALAGGRFMYFYSKLSLTGNRGFVSASDSASVDWVDPFVGGRWLVPIVGNLDLSFRGDIGGFGAGSQLAWNLVSGFQYALPWRLGSAQTRAFAGYKVLDFDDQTGSGERKRSVDLNLRGPAIGVAFEF